MPERADLTAATALKRAAAVLCTRSDDIAADIADEIHALLPQLTAHAGLVTETKAAARATLMQFFAMLREDVEPERAQLTPEMTRLIREFVHRGVDLPGLLHTLRIGHALIWKGWFDELRRQCDDPLLLGDALGLAAQLQFAYVDALSTHAAQEHRTEHDRWARSADAVRVDVLRAILAREEIDALVASSRLGYELRRSHLGIALWTDEDRGAAGLNEARGMARQIAAALDSPRPLIIPIGERLVAAWIGAVPALSADESQQIALAALPQAARRISIGTVGEGIEGFRRTHQEAIWARGVAVRATTNTGPVVHYETVALASIALAALEQATNFVIRELGPLARDNEDAPRLASTLSVYLEEGASLDRAARRLGVHKNTVLNRVKRARELMGRGLDERPLELQVALAFARYIGDLEAHDPSSAGGRGTPRTGL